MSALPVSNASTSSPVIEVRDLRVSFTGSGASRKTVNAVNGVDLTVGRAETLALIGESGSGKSVTLRALLRLHAPGRTRISGSVRVAGQEVLSMGARTLADYRGRVASMIFQEPLLAMDPVYTISQQIVESICRHESVSRTEARRRALELFERVRIPSPERRLDAYPHELSGGMRQRAMIALALACRPQVLLADEPTTALDATVQIQILLLLRELQKELGLAIIFVTHDIGAAVEVADRFAVMYAGRIVEEASAATVVRVPRHPYTLALLQGRAGGRTEDAMSRRERLPTIPGSPPDLSALPEGCSFAARCRFAEDACRSSVPVPVVLNADHRVRCFRTDATCGAR
jgi:peptide/nickel transport system ATP-binding protein